MKEVLISINPKWCEPIASGIKTVEARKTRPMLETPFKVRIYCTKGRGDCLWRWNGIWYDTQDPSHRPNRLDGKIIGEFVCDKIEDFYCASVPYREKNNLGYGKFIDNGVYKVEGYHEGIVFEKNDRYIDSMLKNSDLENMCLSAQEIFEYIGIGKHLYAWHISDLVIYDKPRELSEFHKPCEDMRNCLNKAFRESGHSLNKCFDCGCRITRPPQSWCYVEGSAE